MKKIIVFLGMFFCLVSLTSCLKSGLDEMPTYSDTDISNFNFEYRWYNDDANHLEVTLMKTAYTIDKENATVTCSITVPTGKVTLPEEKRTQVSLSNLVGYCDLSAAAIITPIGDSPKLGDIQDFSKTNMQYEVLAADGSKKVWTLIITAFNK